jgi:hypothetical protein
MYYFIIHNINVEYYFYWMPTGTEYYSVTKTENYLISHIIVYGADAFLPDMFVILVGFKCDNFSVCSFCGWG